MPSHLTAAVKAIPNLPAITGRAAVLVKKGHSRVFVPAIWIGALPGYIPKGIRASIGDEPTSSYAEAQSKAMAMARFHADQTGDPVGYGYVEFIAGDIAVTMPAFVESVHRPSVRPPKSLVPSGRCRECGDYGVIPVHGDGGESHGDQVKGAAARGWLGPWACATCGSAR